MMLRLTVERRNARNAVETAFHAEGGKARGGLRRSERARGGAMAEKSEAESTGSAPPAGGPHFLETEWVLWEHRAPDKSSKSYEDNMEKLVEFATVEDFWNAWNHIPAPSGIFYDGKTKKRFSNRIVESFSLFKKGIKPEWEDPANRAGAEWFCRRPFTPAQLDEFWLNLALGVIGETIDPADEICGARLVDKSSNARCMYRLELWFRKKDETIANDLLQRMQGALGKASAPLKWEFRPH